MESPLLPRTASLTGGTVVLAPCEQVRQRSTRLRMATSGCRVRGFTVLRSLWHRHPDFQLESTDAVFETFRAIQPILRDDYFVETSEDDDTKSTSRIRCPA